MTFCGYEGLCKRHVTVGLFDQVNAIYLMYLNPVVFFITYGKKILWFDDVHMT